MTKLKQVRNVNTLRWREMEPLTITIKGAECDGIKMYETQGRKKRSM